MTATFPEKLFAVKKTSAIAPDPPDGGHSFGQGKAKITMFPDKKLTRASGSAGAAVYQRHWLLPIFHS